MFDVCDLFDIHSHRQKSLYGENRYFLSKSVSLNIVVITTFINTKTFTVVEDVYCKKVESFVL